MTEINYEDYKSFLPPYKLAKEQVEFHEDTFNLVTTNRDTTKVTVIPAPCGIGKSTFIRSFMLSCLCDKDYNFRSEPIGLVIITDNLDRLNGMKSCSAEGNEHLKGFVEKWAPNHQRKLNYLERLVYFMDSDNLVQHLQAQQRCPIVLLTTQRYFMLSEGNREMLFKYNFQGKEHSRNIVLFDERPYFTQTAKIDRGIFLKIEKTFYRGLGNKADKRKAIIKLFCELKDYVFDVIDEKESLRETKNIALSWHCEDEEIIKIYDLLTEAIKPHMATLAGVEKSFRKDWESIGQFLNKGAIFYSAKAEYGTYDSMFIMMTDNRECFYFGQNRKFFVFDATADIDPVYAVDYVEVLNCNKYKKPVNDFEIIHIEVNTSRNVLLGKNQKKNRNCIYKHIEENSKKGMAAGYPLVISYKEIENEISFPDKGYFGNVKGSNNYRNLSRMAQVGMNRFPNIEYFMIMCGCNMKLYSDVLQKSESESIEFFDSIVNKAAYVENVMLKAILTDFEQNMYRIAIRNYDNKKRIKVFWYYSSQSQGYEKLLQLMKDRYGCVGAQITEMGMPVKIAAQKAMVRKAPGDAEKTHVQLIIGWVNSQSLRSEFKIKQLLDGTGLMAKQFQSAKQKSSVLKEWFKNAETERKGYYKVKKRIGVD